MAHTCPDCGQTCYCRGDIDDCIFDDTVDHVLCEHCDDEATYEDEWEEA